jgi:hypothetical protein
MVRPVRQRGLADIKRTDPRHTGLDANRPRSSHRHRPTGLLRASLTFDERAQPGISVEASALRAFATKADGKRGVVISLNRNRLQPRADPQNLLTLLKNRPPQRSPAIPKAPVLLVPGSLTSGEYSSDAKRHPRTASCLQFPHTQRHLHCRHAQAWARKCKHGARVVRRHRRAGSRGRHARFHGRTIVRVRFRL